MNNQITKWTVPYIDLNTQFLNQEQEILSEIKRILEEGAFILRPAVAEFEESIASLTGAKHAIGLNSGTDALILSVLAAGVGPGDEVITVSHTHVATLAAVHHAGAIPVLIDIGEDFNMDPDEIEAAITSRTKAIIPVHLNGRVCDMDVILEIADKHDLIVIEDSAQALGAYYRGKAAGTFGIAGCFSTHPMKNLGCAGDGGFVVTDDDDLAERFRLLRNHGQKSRQEIVLYGYSSRLDNLQAAILNVKLKRLPQWLERRRDIAKQYSAGLADLPIKLPPRDNEAPIATRGAEAMRHDVFSSYVIQTEHQAELVDYLVSKGIETFVHFGPTTLADAPNLQKRLHGMTRTRETVTRILSLPIYPEMTDEQIQLVISAIHQFHHENGLERHRDV